VDLTVLDSDTICSKPQIWVQPETWGEILSTDAPRWLNSEEMSKLHPNCPTRIWGTCQERTQLIALCTEYIGIFSRELNRQPALVPPMEIVVDEDKWFVKANQLAPRLMNNTKQLEIARKTADMVDKGIIRPFLWPSVVSGRPRIAT